MVQRIEVDTKTFVRFWLVILAFALLALIIWKALTGLIIVFIAIFLAIALRPLAQKIDSIDKRHKRNSLSSVLAVIIVVVGIAAVIGLVGPVVINETSRFLGQIPDSVNSSLSGDAINNLGDKIGIPDLKGQLITAVKDFSTNMITNFSNFAMTSVSAVVNFITATILVIVLTILFMLQGPEMIQGFWQTLAGRGQGKHAKTIATAERITSRMADVVAKYVSGQLLVAILDGTVTGLAVLVRSFIFGFSAGLALPLGLVALVLYMIPMVGPIINCVIVSLLLFFSAPAAGLAFAIFYIIYAQIENNLIAPKIQGKGMSLPPAIILAAITIGMYAFGLIGTIVAIPIAGCLRVLFEEYPNLKALNE